MPTRFVRVRVPETGTHVTLPATAAAVQDKSLPRVHGPAVDRTGAPRPPKRSLNHQPPAPVGDGDTSEATPSTTPDTTEE